MKNTNFIAIMLLFALFIATSCEKADFQKPLVTQEPVVPRDPAIECEDCPVEDCCCAVELEEGTAASIEICGSSSPNNSLTPCGPDTWGNCTIQGFLLPYTLNGGNPIEIFCMPPGSAFSIKVLSPGVRARVSCKYGQLGSTSVDVFQGKTNIYVDGNCDVSTTCP